MSGDLNRVGDERHSCKAASSGGTTGSPLAASALPWRTFCALPDLPDEVSIYSADDRKVAGPFVRAADAELIVRLANATDRTSTQDSRRSSAQPSPGSREGGQEHGCLASQPPASPPGPLASSAALSQDELAEIRDRAEFVQSFLHADSSQAGGYLDELSADVLRLLAAMEANHAK